MEFFGSPLYHIIVWSFGVVFWANNFRNIPPFTLKPGAKKRLREEALALLESSDKPSFIKEVDRDKINADNKFEHLRLYAILADKHKTIRITSFVSSLRWHRMTYRTNMRSKSVTPESFAVFETFYEVSDDLLVGLDKKPYRKRQSDIYGIAFYAMQHMDKADRIVSLVEERGITKLKDIKALLKDIDELPSSALAEGML